MERRGGACNGGNPNTPFAPDCTVTPVLEGLNRPTAVAVGADGAIYVTNNGVTAGEGEVLRIAA